MKIYYFHSLYLNFNSSQTIQVIRDYRYLSEKGFDVTLSGVYDDEQSFNDIKEYIGAHRVKIIASKGISKIPRLISKLRFFIDVFRYSKQKKCFVTRSHHKSLEILRYRYFLPNSCVVMELHEHALPFLIQGKKRVNKRSYEKLFSLIDGLILTNYSQEKVLLDEFTSLPRYSILPNGVEAEQFSQAHPPASTHSSSKIVITYAGQFSSWKNIELIFQAMALLGERYQLRIAGGKGNDESKRYILQLTEKYNLTGRVDFRGFVKPDKLVCHVLNGSSVLLLPLGDNIESKYFTSPMKLFEYMATAIPVVSVNHPSVNMITGEDTVFLASTDPVDFARAIQEASCCEDSERIRKMNKIAANYSYENRARRFSEFINSYDDG